MQTVWAGQLMQGATTLPAYRRSWELAPDDPQGRLTLSKTSLLWCEGLWLTVDRMDDHMDWCRNIWVGRPETLPTQGGLANKATTEKRAPPDGNGCGCARDPHGHVATSGACGADVRPNPRFGGRPPKFGQSRAQVFGAWPKSFQHQARDRSLVASRANSGRSWLKPGRCEPIRADAAQAPRLVDFGPSSNASGPTETQIPPCPGEFGRISPDVHRHRPAKGNFGSKRRACSAKWQDTSSGAFACARRSGILANFHFPEPAILGFRGPRMTGIATTISVSSRHAGRTNYPRNSRKGTPFRNDVCAQFRALFWGKPCCKPSDIAKRRPTNRDTHGKRAPTRQHPCSNIPTQP